MGVQGRKKRALVVTFLFFFAESRSSPVHLYMADRNRWIHNTSCALVSDLLLARFDCLFVFVLFCFRLFIPSRTALGTRIFLK